MSEKNKPNVLLLLTDDQRFDTLGAMGNQAIHTPHMDRLAAEGMLFTQAHIPCGTCPAVCMPSRAMLHTGRSLFHLKESGSEIPGEHATLGETLAKAGYRTFGTGKWHNGRESFNRSFAEGDEIFFGGMADHWNVPAYHYDPSGQYAQTIRRLPNAVLNKFPREYEVLPADHIRSGEHSTDTIAGALKNWLRTQSAQTPFFAYAAFLAPHDPRTMPERFRVMYDPESLELPPNLAGGHLIDTGALRIRDELLAQFPRRPEEIRVHLAEYYGMISHLDDQFGQIVQTLKEQGLYDNTLIVFTGDNGLAVGQHGLMGKQSCYEHSVRVPLVMRGPGVPLGGQNDSPCYLFDLFSTICALCEVPIPASVEGQSLLPCLTDPQARPRDGLLFAYAEFQRAYKKNGWKVIEYAGERGHVATQLFDLRTDPWECVNLADRPENCQRLSSLREELWNAANAWGDPTTSWGRLFWSRCRIGRNSTDTTAAREKK